MDSSDVNIAEQAEKLRALQQEALSEDPQHVPLVMCPTCGHTSIVPRSQPEIVCARNHVILNPHYLPAEPSSFAVPAGDQQEFEDLTEGGLGLADAIKKFRQRPNDATRSASTVRFLAVVALYAGLLAAVFAGLRWISRF